MTYSAVKHIRAYDDRPLVQGSVQDHVRCIDVPYEYSALTSAKLTEINFLLGEISRVQREMDRLDRARKNGTGNRLAYAAMAAELEELNRRYDAAECEIRAVSDDDWAEF